MPIRPRDGSTHCDSTDGAAVEVALKPGSPLYSYFQSGSSGCFKSQSGRRLRTTGMVPKLYSGGGELVDHSSVHASQGSFPAISPRNRDQSRFPTNTRIAAP